MEKPKVPRRNTRLARSMDLSIITMIVSTRKISAICWRASEIISV